MAAVTRLGTATFDTNSGTKTVTATPASGDLIFIVAATTGSIANTAPTDDNSDGLGTYTLAATNTSASKNSTSDRVRIYVRDALIGSGSSTVFTHAPGATTGGGLVVLKVTGMTRIGVDAVKKAGRQQNQTSGTPAPSFGSAADSANAIIGVVFNNVNPAGMTPPTGYTERSDIGYASPATGLEIATLDSGETGTTITWGSAGGTDWCSIVAEVDVSVPTAAITGTATDSITEADVVTGGKTIIVTLTNDTWLAAGTGPIGTTANTQAIIDGIDSAQSEANGWDAVVRPGIETADVVRTSNTVATITLDAEATYNITAQETITVTVPAEAVTSALSYVATPTFTVSATASTRIKDVIGRGMIARKR